MLRTKIAKSEGILFSTEIQNAVKAELNEMLAAPFFAQSARCKKFLSHVVLQTLSGNASQLKERTIGISVFDRANDYDTGEDAIVRVTANDVRKRIGQFYQESRVAHPVQIDLPRGTYVPEFRIRLGVQAAGTPEPIATDAPAQEARQAEPELPILAETHPPSVVPDQPAPSLPIPAITAPPQKSGPRRPWITIAFLVLIFIAMAVLGELWRSGARDSVPEIWDAFLQSKARVLVCLGTHDFSVANTAPAATTEDVVMREETLPIDDISVVSSMAHLLGNKGIPFRLAAADQTSLTDLHAQPVILIGAVDNKWTLQLTQALRYRVAVDFPSGQDKPPVASIIDAEQPSQAPWKADFSVPLSTWKSDYAIVAREDDATIGVPVLIEAGLGCAGGLAASEIITSGALTSALKNEPSCKGKSNFETVIETDIVDNRPRPPHILRLTCW